MPDDERFLGSVRRECLNHFLIFQEKQLYRLLKAYVMYFRLDRIKGLGSGLRTRRFRLLLSRTRRTR